MATEAYLSECKSLGRSSPAGSAWHDFWTRLSSMKSAGVSAHQSPLILAACGRSDASKHSRLREQLKWAERNALLDMALSWLAAIPVSNGMLAVSTTGKLTAIGESSGHLRDSRIADSFTESLRPIDERGAETRQDACLQATRSTWPIFGAEGIRPPFGEKKNVKKKLVRTLRTRSERSIDAFANLRPAGLQVSRSR